jgi:O-antigen ligase
MSLPFCFQPFLRRNWFTIVKAVVVTVIAIVIGLQSGTINLDETFRKAGQDLTMKQRLIIWEAACIGIGNSPWIGNSLRGFRSFFGKYVEANRVDLEEKYGAVENDHSHPHNVVLGLLFMYGIIGLPLFLWAVIPAVKYAFYDFDEVFLALIVFHFLNGMFDFNLHRVPGALMLFFPVGFIYGTRFRQSAAIGQKTLVEAVEI